MRSIFREARTHPPYTHMDDLYHVLDHVFVSKNRDWSMGETLPHPKTWKGAERDSVIRCRRKWMSCEGERAV